MTFMRLVRCAMCDRLSAVYPGLGGIHACACVPENKPIIFGGGIVSYRELDKDEGKVLADYVKEQAEGYR